MKEKNKTNISISIALVGLLAALLGFWGSQTTVHRQSIADMSKRIADLESQNLTLESDLIELRKKVARP